MVLGEKITAHFVSCSSDDLSLVFFFFVFIWFIWVSVQEIQCPYDFRRRYYDQ